VKFGTESNQQRRGGKTTTSAKRKYGAMGEHGNPWGRLVHEFNDDRGYYYHGMDTPAIRAVKSQFQTEQLARIKKADGFTAAFNEAVPLGEIDDASRGYSAHVKYPKRVLAMLWAKARHDGVLNAPIDNFVPQERMINSFDPKLYNKHHQYAWSGASGSIHGALLRMAQKSGYHDLVHAMVESGLRHNPKGDLDEAMSEVHGPYATSPDHIKAMQKLAEAQGIMDTDRIDLPSGHPLMANTYYGSTTKVGTVREHLDEKMAAWMKAIKPKETENV